MTASQHRTFDDIELMQFVDGELDDASAEALASHLDSELLAEDDRAALTVQSLDQMGDTLRSYLELEADDAEPRLDAMWVAIDAHLQHSAPAEVAEKRSAASGDDNQGLWARIVGFFEGYRGHILTGAVAAGAAAAVILALRPPQQVVVERPIAQHQPADSAPVLQVPLSASDIPPPTPAVQVVKDEPTPPEIESLEVTDGSGTVFLLPSEGDDDVSATVIFVDFDDDEGPIL